jgi:hypothetical protein
MSFLVVSGRRDVRLGVLICGVELFRRVQLTLVIYYDSRVSRLADHPGLTLSGVTSSTHTSLAPLWRSGELCELADGVLAQARC